MTQNQDYLQRLADLDAALARARPDPSVLVGRAAGLLAGRVGCRVDEAMNQLRQLATELGRDVSDVAVDVLTTLERRSAGRPGDVRAAVGEALRDADRSVPAARPAADPAADAAADTGTPEWVGVMRQVLDAVTGNHTAVLPRRDDAGQVEDFVLAAVSPTVVDLAGRSGDQILGRVVSEVYPEVRDGPIWQAWKDTLRDGLAREVGPLPYLGTTLVVRTHRVGPGLLNSWVRPDEQVRLSERIAQTERLGGLGWGEWDLLTGNVVWSDELYRIYERDPALGPFSDEESRALRLPEDEPIHQQAAETFERGHTVDVTYRARIGSKIKYLRTVADAVRDTDGRPIKVYGIVQDVTAREVTRTHLAEVERRLREQQETLAAEHRLAAQLQQIILPVPEHPVELPGVQFAVRYVPAEQANRVGGDWYHAGVTDSGDVLLAVGDVAGHGIRAATTMARLRHALAAFSITSSTDPAELLAYLNRLLRADGPAGDTATAVIVRYSPGTGTVVWAQAGHPPPLLSRAGRTVELGRPRGPLLGAVRNPNYGTATATLHEGDLLLLYTDGLIEHRHRSTSEGFAPVVRTLDEFPADLSLLDLLGRLRSANTDDDTCIMAARRTVPARVTA